MNARYDTTRRSESCGTLGRRVISGDAIIDATPSRDGDQMGQWLIADVSLLDIHLQLWMLLVTGVMLLWIIYVWATQ